MPHRWSDSLKGPTVSHMAGPDQTISRLHPALSKAQGVALHYEVQSAQNLMRDSVEAIRGMREPSLAADAVFTLGSIGVEKTLKVLLGCVAVDTDGAWPSHDTMRSWGHDINSLDARLTDAAREGVPRTVATGYSETLAARVETSSIRPLLFATLSRYGLSGRFHYLDILGSRAQNDDSPLIYLERLQRHISETEDAFKVIPFHDVDKFEGWRRRMSHRIADEVNLWWYSVHRLGMQGAFGELGKNVGFGLWPPGRSRPI